ncbi:MAG: hypothetical protein GEU99_07405 [Luteitalea sp.]|nr:hypothetical protein [Luteitalea sp.]
MNRFRTASIATHAAALVLVGVLGGCGKKGPPLAPLRLLPVRIEDVRATRQANTVRVTFTIPNKNADGTTPADIAYVLVYGITGEPVGPASRALDADEWELFATPVGRIDVALPPPPDEGEADEEEAASQRAARAALAKDPRPAQGESVTVTETLDTRAQTRFVHPDVAAGVSPRGEERPRAGRPPRGAGGPPPPTETSPPASPEEASDPAALVATVARGVWPAPERLLERFYVAIPFARGNRVAAVSNAAAIPLAATPPAPRPPEVTYTADAFTLKWQVPARIRMPVQRPVNEARAEEGWLPARPALPGVPPHAFAIYELPGPSAPASAARLVTPVPVSPTDPVFEDPRLQFGRQRCYAVRTIQAFPSGTLESPLSPATCVTPKDTFAPAAPANLSSVGSEGGVSLIWEPNREPDLAGYVVLRGEPGQPLEPITSSPIKETTYRDTTAEPGVTYEYAVVAVDVDGNRSDESNRVEDMAQ